MAPPGGTVTICPAISDSPVALAEIGAEMVARAWSVRLTPDGAVAPALITPEAKTRTTRSPRRRRLMVLSIR
jgi:hypothetical protein